MMYIHMTFSKKKTLHSTPLHSTHSTELFKIFFSLLTLSTAFLQKASGPGKNHYMARAKFEVNIIDHKHNTIKCKLSEALHIHRNQPELNEKSELEHIVKYMSQ